MAKKSKTVNSKPFLPWELIDEILVHVDDPDLAIELKRFAIVERIYPDYDFHSAISNGKLGYLKYLNGRGLCTAHYDEEALDVCVANDHLNILKYCHEHINPITEYVDIMNFAASNGHLDLVKYLHSIGSKCTNYAMNWAACEGYLDVLEFLHYNRQEGCTKFAMTYAARNGHLEVVKFLYHHRTEGIPKEALEFARKSVKQNVVEFLENEIEKGRIKSLP
jgi:ankyrin repeat protein